MEVLKVTDKPTDEEIKKGFKIDNLTDIDQFYKDKETGKLYFIKTNK